jgi:hypothetical protein
MTAIEISDELAAVLKTKAAASGLTVDTWLKSWLLKTRRPKGLHPSVRETRALRPEWGSHLPRHATSVQCR